MSATGGVAGTETAGAEPREEPVRILARLALALGAAALVAGIGASELGRQLKGPVTITGYPIYADFDPNHYLVVFYFAAFVFPLLSLLLYQLESMVGPLRRTVSRKRAARSGPTPSLNVATRAVGLATTSGGVGVGASIGGLLGLELAVVEPLGGGAVIASVLAGAALFALASGSRLALAGARGAATAARDVAALALAGTALVLVLLFEISERTAVVVSPGAHLVHYRFFPLPALCVTLLALLAGSALAMGRGVRAERIAWGLAVYLVVPLGLFLLIASIPGTLGKMDAFGEGEYLGGSYLLLHGSLPWRDLYLIHGLLDDGLKPLVGYGLFGMTRWGATAGIDFIWAPAYWVATYLFTALVFGRRWVALVAAAGAVGLGIFANWDVRYLFWPLVLALLAVTLRRRSWRVGAVLGLLTLIYGLLVPEMLYAAVAIGVTLVAYECYERGGARPHWRDFPRSIGAAGAAAAGAAAFFLWLCSVGALSGFVGYFTDFASAHSLSGGIPLFTNYALPGRLDSLGVLHFAVLTPPLLTRYPLETILPVGAALATFALFCSAVRGGRRLCLEDWVTLCAAGLTVLYYPKGLSRADEGHIGESFAVAVPLLICLSYRLVVALDDRVHRALRRLAERERRGAPAGFLRRASGRLELLSSPVGVVLVGAVLGLAPSSPFTLLESAPAHFRVAVSTAPPVAVAGAGGLGYNDAALPPGLVEDMASIVATYAGKSRTVFDFTNAPALFDFLLGTPPGSALYDVNLAITDAAQEKLVGDLEASRPRIAIFEGEVGLPRWDYLENEVRDHIVSQYLLSHYRPLVLVNGELVLVADDLHHLPPLPPLAERPVTKELYFSQRACAFGYIPDFLPSPAARRVATLPVVQVVAPRSQGRVYRVLLPKGPAAFSYLEVTRSDASAAGSFVISNLRARSRRDISWVAAATRSITTVEVGSCLQWRGFGQTLYLRYKGPGVPTSVALLS